MSQIFYVNYVDKVKIKVNGDSEDRELFDKFLPDLVFDNLDEVDYTFTIKKSLIKPQLPAGLKAEKAFASSDYYKWSKKDTHYAYTDGNKYACKHFVIRNGKDIKVYYNKNDEHSAEVAIKVLRELILRVMFSQGYVPVHSASFEQDGKAYVFFGGKNAGKSTSLLLFSKELGYNPLTNDMSLMKIVGDEVEVYGWFYKISYQTRAEYLLKTQTREEVDNKKVKIFPKDYVTQNNLKWCWKAKLGYFVNVKCNYFADSYSFTKLTEDKKAECLPNVYDDWGFCDYLNIYDRELEIEKLFNSLPVYHLAGNISLLCIELSLKEILTNQFGMQEFRLEKAKIGTGNNYKVHYNGKEYFGKVTFFDEGDRDICKNIREIECYKALSKNKNLPIKEYLKTKDGKYVGVGANYYVTLQEWVDGETMDNFEGGEDYLMQCSRYLAEINVGLKNKDFPKKMLDLFDRFDFIIEKTEGLLKVLETKEHNETYKKVKECLEWKVSALKELSQMKLPDINKFTFCNSHGDYSILQTIKRANQVYKIIDFENVACYPVIWEIVRSFVLSDIDAGKCILNKERLDKYLDEYQKINPLTKFDLDNKYILYLTQLLQSNYGFYNYIESRNEDLLDFAYWRINFSKELFKEVKNENRL